MHQDLALTAPSLERETEKRDDVTRALGCWPASARDVVSARSAGEARGAQPEAKRRAARASSSSTAASDARSTGLIPQYSTPARCLQRPARSGSSGRTGVVHVKQPMVGKPME